MKSKERYLLSIICCICTGSDGLDSAGLRFASTVDDASDRTSDVDLEPLTASGIFRVERLLELHAGAMWELQYRGTKAVIGVSASSERQRCNATPVPPGGFVETSHPWRALCLDDVLLMYPYFVARC